MKRSPWAAVVLVCVLGLGLQWLVYGCSRSQCEDRGGHLETVYGGRGGWVCDLP